MNRLYISSLYSTIRQYVTVNNTHIKSAAFCRESFFDDALLFLAEVGKLSKLSVRELESILGEGSDDPRDFGVIAAEMDDFLDDDDGVGVRSLLADAILGCYQVVS